MSHFVVLVLVPGDTQKEDIPHAVVEVLEPYDECLKVPQHEQECPCVGLAAQAEVDEQIRKDFNFEGMRKKFSSLAKRKQTHKEWDAMIAPMLEARKKLLEEHPMKNTPDSTCTCCSGTGKYLTEANPAGKWDWWVVGGRWDGWIFGPEKEKERQKLHESGSRTKSEEEELNDLLESNVRPVREIDWSNDHYLPFAVVTQEGWVEVGKMMMFAIVDDEMPDKEWHAVVRNIMDRHMDCLAVAVDCHV